MESVRAFTFVAVIYELVELSECDMGIDAATLLEILLRFSMLSSSYIHGSGAKLLDDVL